MHADGRDHGSLFEMLIPWENVMSIFTQFPAISMAEIASWSTFQNAWMQSNWIDLVVILALLSGIFTGVGVGFYRSTAILLGSAAGVLLAGQFAVPLSLNSIFDSVRVDVGPLPTQILAGALIFGTCTGVAFLTTVILRSFFDRTLRFCDNVLGGLMGTSIAILLMGIIFLGVFQWQDSRLHRPIQESLSGPSITSCTQQLGRFFPQEFRERFDLSSRRILENQAGDIAGVLATSGDPPRSDPRD